MGQHLADHTQWASAPLAGISAVRCSWGGAQEAAALAQLAAAFPDAAVEEVRLSEAGYVNFWTRT